MTEIKQLVTSHALTLPQLYTRFPVQKYLKGRLFDLTPTPVKKQYICARVLAYFLKLVFWDIINNNITFKFPSGTKCYFEMNTVSGENFKTAIQNGAFQEVDFLKSGFRGNQLQFRYNTRYGHWVKPVYVSGKMKRAIIENTNNGKSYG